VRADTDIAPLGQIRKEDGSLEIKEEEGDKVPFPTWDPDGGDHVTKYSKYAQPLKATLRKGDLLYLPALWYESFLTFFKFILIGLGITKSRNRRTRKEFAVP